MDSSEKPRKKAENKEHKVQDISIYGASVDHRLLQDLEFSQDKSLDNETDDGRNDKQTLFKKGRDLNVTGKQQKNGYDNKLKQESASNRNAFLDDLDPPSAGNSIRSDWGLNYVQDSSEKRILAPEGETQFHNKLKK